MQLTQFESTAIGLGFLVISLLLAGWSAKQLFGWYGVAGLITLAGVALTIAVMLRLWE